MHTNTHKPIHTCIYTHTHTQHSNAKTHMHEYFSTNASTDTHTQRWGAGRTLSRHIAHAAAAQYPSVALKPCGIRAREAALNTNPLRLSPGRRRTMRRRQNRKWRRRRRKSWSRPGCRSSRRLGSKSFLPSLATAGQHIGAGAAAAAVVW